MCAYVRTCVCIYVEACTHNTVWEREDRSFMSVPLTVLFLSASVMSSYTSPSLSMTLRVCIIASVSRCKNGSLPLQTYMPATTQLVTLVTGSAQSPQQDVAHDIVSYLAVCARSNVRMHLLVRSV